MVKELIHDPIFLAQKSRPATKEDLNIAQDLLDTLSAHKETCVGMAANMIGAAVRIIAFDNAGTYMVMLNPEIISCSGEYEAEESKGILLGRFAEPKEIAEAIYFVGCVSTYMNDSIIKVDGGKA